MTERRRCRTRWAGAAVLAALACGTEDGGERAAALPAPDTVRVVLFNIRELTTEKVTTIDADGRGTDPQARAAAEIIRRVRPDVLVLNEIDHDYGSAQLGLAENARRFARNYLDAPGDPLGLDHAFAIANNTGLLSGVDLNGDGVTATEADVGTRTHGDDSFGYGEYPGQYSMALLSRFPVDSAGVRAFQTLLWADLPGHHLPPAHFSTEALGRLRLSSKSHWDVPIRVGDTRLRVLMSHPTPPSFDGPEDKNGRRNFDELRLWALYLDGSADLIDDAGVGGGYPGEDPFVIAGDLNARPDTDESIYDGRTAIAQLLEHPRVQESGPWTVSEGALLGREPGPPGYPERSTASFLGGSRVDYLLPSADLRIVGGGVFWPDSATDPAGASLAATASDHHLVWLDLVLPSLR